jgi:ATP-binding cassette subfamily B protein
MNTTSSARGLAALYKAYWRFADGKRRQILLSNSLLVMAQLVKLAIPWLAAQAINDIQLHGTENLHHAAGMIALIVGATVVSWAMHGPGRVLERSVGIQIRANLTDAIYERVSHLPLAWHEEHHSGETSHRLQKTTGALYQFAQTQFIYFQNLINLIGPIVLIAILSPIAGVVAAVGYLVIGLVLTRFDHLLGRLADRENQAERRYAATLIDYLGNISTVVSLRLQTTTRKLLGERLAHVFVPLKRAIVLIESKWCASDVMTVSFTWGLVGLYAWLVRANGGELLLGNLFMIYQYAQQTAGVMTSVAANYQDLIRIRTDYASADPVWAATPRAVSHPSDSGDWKRIEIEGLTFSYPGRTTDRPSLQSVSLTLRRGERLAIVGPSGAGKSSLIRLLAGLYDADRGHFSIDGVAHVPLRQLGALATLVPQDAEVFEASVRDNLTFGHEHSPETIREALRLAGLEEFVAALPQGLDTVVSERGLNLSGGQNQRLALARGLLAAKDSSLLLLDEPTSSLDPVIESRIFAALHEALPRATIVASVHRLNLLPRFDRVVLMSHGKVVDVGTVADLLKRQPLFAEMWSRSTGSVVPRRAVA